MKKYLLLLLLLLACIHSQAQTTDSTKTKKISNHIGLNTQFAQDGFFNPNARTPLQMMYKRQNKKNNGAWRVGLGAYYRVEEATWTSLRDVGSTYYFNGNFSLGYEWQKPITKKWLIYYGVDANLAWQYKKFDGERDFDIVINGVLIKLNGFDENYTLTPAISPFLGGRFNLGNHFYIATEFSLQLHQAKNQQSIRFEGRGAGAKGDVNYSNYGFSVKPYGGIYLFYLI
jgi:hypothetical protein